MGIGVVPAASLKSVAPAGADTVTCAAPSAWTVKGPAGVPTGAAAVAGVIVTSGCGGSGSPPLAWASATMAAVAARISGWLARTTKPSVKYQIAAWTAAAFCSGVRPAGASVVG